MKFQKIFTNELNSMEAHEVFVRIVRLKKRADFIVPNLLIVQKYSKKLWRSEFKRELP